ncbi:hypothetical protein P1J78_10255 [Psychromarinibacter sp. C21-152]|uniref:Uncharacterized protein n=1 Tax=Psychromarinibacter sediminicola TaxID=3033385 RepID=A0AAE3NV01_9RHOB|nr:hypothetical protein [Psychromarinibacter sediminicola]MDF0601112.1 hypothetical protein [Psychromarinibacter sediminicola]
MSETRQSRVVGYLLKLFAVIGGFAIFAVGQEIFPSSEDLQKAMLGVGIGVGGLLWWRGSKHLQPLAETVMASDTRPPVLYLRSFANEADVHAEERGFADLLAPVGPLIAIGQPGETLPPLGAARLYVPKADEWQAKVSDLLGRSRYVLIYGGRTPGLGWELRQVRQRLSPEQLVVMIPNDQPAWNRFRQLAYEKADLFLPPLPEGPAMRHVTAGVAGFLSFDRDWHPHFTPLPPKSTRATAGWSDTAAQSAMALADILEARGEQVDRPSRSGLLIYIHIMRAYFYLLGIVLVVLALVGLYYWSTGQLVFTGADIDWIGPPPVWWPFD